VCSPDANPATRQLGLISPQQRTLPFYTDARAVANEKQAQKFFRDNDMTIPETDQVPLTAGDQIEGVPAITSVLPSLGPEVAGMAFAMAGSKVGNGGRARWPLAARVFSFGWGTPTGLNSI